MYTPETCKGCPIVVHLNGLGQRQIFIHCEPTPDEKKFGSNGHDLADVTATDKKGTLFCHMEKVACAVLRIAEEEKEKERAKNINS